MCGTLLEDAIAYNAAINASGDVDQWQIALQLLHGAKCDASASSLLAFFKLAFGHFWTLARYKVQRQSCQNKEASAIFC